MTVPTLASPATSAPPATPSPLVRRPRRVAVMLIVAFGLTSIGLLAAPRTTLAWNANSFNSTSERQLVTLTNQARASAGLRSLKVDSTLTSIARWRSKDMIVQDYFSHTIKGTSYNVFHVLDQKGYCYKIAGENIGWNNYPDDVATTTIQRQFMDSPGHRSNILGKAWDVIGVGAYKGPTGKKMWTVIFADRCGSTTPKPTPKPTPRPTPKPTTHPKPTPKPTPKATAKAPATATASPTPAATSTPPDLLTETPGGNGNGFGPGGAGGENGNGADNGDGGASGNGPPPGHIRDATPGTGEATLQVVDPPTTPGLFEAVVAGVTGFFLGS